VLAARQADGHWVFELEADATAIDAVDGFNYSRGRPVHITLYRVTPPHQETSPPQE